MASSPWLPDPDEARNLIETELSHARYAQAEPNWWDRFVSTIFDFFKSLFNLQAAGGAGPLIAVVVAIIIVVLLVLAIVVWGRPRLLLRSAARGDALFGEEETRNSPELRASAEELARVGNWDGAFIMRTKALARSLHERGIVVLPAGATVQMFAVNASHSFPQEGVRFTSVANTFDSVRYLRKHAGSADYERVRALDEAVAHQRPSHLSDLSLVAGP